MMGTLERKWKPILVSLIFFLLPIGIYVFGAVKKSAIIETAEECATVSKQSEVMS